MSETDDLDQPAPGDANEADAAEQRAPLDDDHRSGPPRGPLPYEVSEADAIEQHLEVPLDEDDYR